MVHDIIFRRAWRAVNHEYLVKWRAAGQNLQACATLSAGRPANAGGQVRGRRPTLVLESTRL
eukprot:COSAG01_NODE_13716_length_1544_cov_42.601384_3_plen_62_part_00